LVSVTDRFIPSELVDMAGQKQPPSAHVHFQSLTLAVDSKLYFYYMIAMTLT